MKSNRPETAQQAAADMCLHRFISARGQITLARTQRHSIITKDQATPVPAARWN